jgi:hypothetical protein
MSFTTVALPATPEERFVSAPVRVDATDATARPPFVRGVQLTVTATGVTVTPRGPEDVTADFSTANATSGVVPLRTGTAPLAAAAANAALTIPATSIEALGVGDWTFTWEVDVVALEWDPVAVADTLTLTNVTVTDGITPETVTAAIPANDNESFAINATVAASPAPIVLGGASTVRVTEFVALHNATPATLGTLVPVSLAVQAPPSATGGTLALTLVAQGSALLVSSDAVVSSGGGEYTVTVPVDASGAGRVTMQAQFLSTNDTIGVSIAAGNATATVGAATAVPVQLEFGTDVPFVMSLGSSGAATVDPDSGAVRTGADFDVVPLFSGIDPATQAPTIQVGVTLQSQVPSFSTDSTAVTLRATLRPTSAGVQWLGQAAGVTSVTAVIPQVVRGQRVPVAFSLGQITGRGTEAIVADVTVESFSTTSVAGASVSIPVYAESVAVAFPDAPATVILDTLRRGQTVSDARSLVVPSIPNDEAWRAEVAVALASTPQAFRVTQLS